MKPNWLNLMDGNSQEKWTHVLPEAFGYCFCLPLCVPCLSVCQSLVWSYDNSSVSYILLLNHHGNHGKFRISNEPLKTAHTMNHSMHFTSARLWQIFWKYKTYNSRESCYVLFVINTLFLACLCLKCSALAVDMPGILVQTNTNSIHLYKYKQIATKAG